MDPTVSPGMQLAALYVNAIPVFTVSKININICVPQMRGIGPMFAPGYYIENCSGWLEMVSKTECRVLDSSIESLHLQILMIKNGVEEDDNCNGNNVSTHHF